MQSRLIRLIGVVFSNGAVLPVSDKSDSVNKCTQEISELMKSHIQEVWQNVRKFIMQLADSLYFSTDGFHSQHKTFLCKSKKIFCCLVH